mmetsp:Transcript_1642/g.1450  ORF Transcript_1642/g.1450 Transcript_1642/m.1450 type:complete len:100 (-) Transcript_1642:57-356(-)
MDFYIDPTSEKHLEFGTKRYPYKSFEPAFVEILHEYSHTKKSINLWVKENTVVYLEDSKAYFINLTQVSISTYSDNEITGFSTLEFIGAPRTLGLKTSF